MRKTNVRCTSLGHDAAATAPLAERVVFIPGMTPGTVGAAMAGQGGEAFAACAACADCYETSCPIPSDLIAAWERRS